MKRAFVSAAAIVLLLVTPALAQRKPCEELKSEIEEKIKKNGVRTFTLDIEPKGEAPKSDASKDMTTGAAAAGKIVGSCDGGTKQIVYKRGAA